MPIIRLTGFDLGEAPALRLTRLRLQRRGVDISITTIAASHEPSVGSVSDLSGPDNAVECVFPREIVQSAAFSLSIDVDSVDAITSVLAIGAAPPQRVLCNQAGGAFDAYKQERSGWWVYALARLSIADVLALTPAACWSLSDASAVQSPLIGSISASRVGGAAAGADLVSDVGAAFQVAVGSYVRFPGITALDAGAFSVSFDMQTVATANEVVLEHGSDNRGWSIQMSPNTPGEVPAGHLFIAFGPQDGRIGSRNAVNDGLPHRVVLCYQPGVGVRLYVDGVAGYVLPSRGPIVSPAYNTTYIDAGSRGGIANLLAGSLIGNVALWARALSEQEVHSLWGAKIPYGAALQTARLGLRGTELNEQGAVSVSASFAGFANDAEFGGQGCIYGTVELYAQAGNIPLPRRVRLHRSRDGLLVRETWSDAQGNYRFDGITDRYKYDVIAWDHEGLQQSVVANDLTPEVMP